MCGDAALPTNTPSIPCVLDPRGSAGICGDRLLASSSESAALSGWLLLSNHGIRSEVFDVGLQTNILPLEGHDIGQFLGLESMEKEEAQAYQPAI
ncbi:hypothetical protein KPL71_024222 [Citrus sinensis]|uniref:Uncharacterized protein n=2 Tax=Citrus sinensis TaxID=2711 RepID=A0ACB8IQ71_CITSI|nr:hypothetical protein KPL71_024222 [Citrus sinensis]KDO38209.1 hypothetical protein CISIN_1g042339mg [Citrus sinensis]